MAMDAKARVHEAFQQCTHEEQVELLDGELGQYLKRDFLALLPPELHEMILAGIPEWCMLQYCIYVSLVKY